MYTETAGDEISRHKCLIYDGEPSEQLPVLVPFLIDGIQNNWRTLYLGAPDLVRMVDSALVRQGVNTADEMKRGALILSSDRQHLGNGHFDPRRMVDMLCNSVDDAVSDGFEGLCASGDMKWELGSEKNFDYLLEYESLLEGVFREKPLKGICQYRRDIVPAGAIRDALRIHRSAYVGDVLNRDNFFYVPPELLLQNGDSEGASLQGEWMCKQILRVLEAERKRDQALHALEEANRSLERRVNERTIELQMANRNLEAFSYSVSHDLRAPLRSIIGFGDILAEECENSLSGDARRHLDRVRTGARRMEELIQGLLALSQVTRTEIGRESLDLSALCMVIVREIRESDPNRPGDFTIGAGMNATGDRVLIRAALANMIGNAWKFTSKQPNGRIEIGEISDRATAKTFFVKDNGPGFDMQFAKRLFEPFQRLHRAEDFPGTGIGLATVERIIERHGGRVWAQGQPNEGATFFFTLPSGD